MSNLPRTVILAFAFTSVALGATRNVPGDFPTIQAAINACNNGDTVLVAPGTYAESINFLGKAITVTSSGGPAVTTIDPSAAASAVSFKTGEGLSSVLSGFTITGGTGTTMGGNDTFGGGIFIDGASPTISGNIIDDNSALGLIFLPGGSGGGIFARNGSPLIQNNTISDNLAEDDGAGICCQGSGSPTISGNSFTLNFCNQSGGAIRAASATITGNTIDGNFAFSSGGGISGGSTISGNTITNNSSLFQGGGISSGGSITGNTIRDNEAGGGFGGLGGGILCGGPALVSANVISGNRAVGDGGGIGVSSGSPKITSNLIVDNRCDFAGAGASGGGIACTGASPILTNNTIARNTAQTAGGGILASSTTQIVNCILWDDTAPSGAEISGSPIVTFSDVEGGFAGTGNINADPQFANAAGGDFHIVPASPCLNAGSNGAPNLPPTDFEGDARIAYAKVDMGGDEIASCLVSFAKFGVGLAGSGGFVPLLDGTLGSCNAGGHVVNVSQGRGGANGNLWIGVSQGDLPFFGGHFYVGFGAPWVTVPIKLSGPPGVPGAGFLNIPGSNVNAYEGVVVYMQVTLADPGAIFGVSLTNGCKVTIGE